ncbi:MAG: bile acid:sodium symporter [Myxococcota bacterium]
MTRELAEWLLPCAMFSLMLAMGLTLQTADFRRVFSQRVSASCGLVLQLVLMPMIGMGLALGFDASALIGAGIVLLAACPGGMLSNLLVHLARANTALSVSLSASATLLTLLTMPLWVRLWFSFSGEAEVAIQIPFARTAFELFLLTLVPLWCGMQLRSRWPRLESFERRLSRLGFIGIVVAMMADFRDREVPSDAFGEAWVPALGLALAGAACGLLVPSRFGVGSRDTATIAVELVAKNGLLALVVARRSLGFEAMLPSLAFAMFQAPVALAVLAGWRYARRTGRDSESAAPAPRGDVRRFAQR